MTKVQQYGSLNIAAGSTTTQTGPDIVADQGARGVTVYVKTTAIGTGSITVTIQGKDVISGDYYTLLTGAAVTTNTTNRYTVFPGATVAANVSANDGLPAIWRILVTANNANPATYTVGWSTLA
jgi:archaellum component FlaF (FlaF/FlaG flagellin family)